MDDKRLHNTVIIGLSASIAIPAFLMLANGGSPLWGTLIAAMIIFAGSQYRA